MSISTFKAQEVIQMNCRNPSITGSIKQSRSRITLFIYTDLRSFVSLSTYRKIAKYRNHSYQNQCYECSSFCLISFDALTGKARMAISTICLILMGSGYTLAITAIAFPTLTKNRANA